MIVHPRVDPSIKDNLAIQEVCRGGYDDVLRILLADPRVDPNAFPFGHTSGERRSNLRLAIEMERDDMAELLLSHPKIDVNLGYRLQPADAGIAHESTFSTPLTLAVHLGNAKMVQLLTAHPSMDPTHGGQGNKAVEIAAAESKWGILRMLLADTRFGKD